MRIRFECLLMRYNKTFCFWLFQSYIFWCYWLHVSVFFFNFSVTLRERPDSQIEENTVFSFSLRTFCYFLPILYVSKCSGTTSDLPWGVPSPNPNDGYFCVAGEVRRIFTPWNYLLSIDLVFWYQIGFFFCKISPIF